MSTPNNRPNLSGDSDGRLAESGHTFMSPRNGRLQSFPRFRQSAPYYLGPRRPETPNRSILSSPRFRYNFYERGNYAAPHSYRFNDNNTVEPSQSQSPIYTSPEYLSFQNNSYRAQYQTPRSSFSSPRLGGYNGSSAQSGSQSGQRLKSGAFHGSQNQPWTTGYNATPRSAFPKDICNYYSPEMVVDPWRGLCAVQAKGAQGTTT